MLIWLIDGFRYSRNRMIALPGARCAQDLGILPILISSAQEATELSED